MNVLISFSSLTDESTAAITKDLGSSTVDIIGLLASGEEWLTKKEIKRLKPLIAV